MMTRTRKQKKREKRRLNRDRRYCHFRSAISWLAPFHSRTSSSMSNMDWGPIMRLFPYIWRLSARLASSHHFSFFEQRHSKRPCLLPIGSAIFAKSTHPTPAGKTCSLSTALHGFHTIDRTGERLGKLPYQRKMIQSSLSIECIV